MTRLPFALLAALWLAHAPIAELHVEGLRDGESFTVLASGPGPTDDYAHGRVVDASTGAPLPGATIELWSEEIDEHYGGYHRFGVATSGLDGRFMVRRREGARTADKLRASAPGYLVFTESVGALYDVITLFPAEAESPRVRFVDLQDRPIQGARVTTTYTCAHDIAAFDYTSDVNGVVVLEGYGLQDSIPELRVLAPGFAGIKYLDGEPVLMASARGDTYTQRLRRTPGFDGTLYDESGASLANSALMVNDGDGYHVVRTDDEGAFSIPSRYGDDELIVRRLTPDPGPGAYGYGAHLRIDGSTVPDGVPTGRVRLVLEDAPEGVTARGLEVATLDGWSASADEEGWIELPVIAGEGGEGSGSVVAQICQASGTVLGTDSDGTPVLFMNIGPEASSSLGTASSTTIRLPLIVAIEAGVEREVTIPWQRAVRATTIPAGVASTVVVEQGDRSRELALDDENDTPIWVAPDEPFTLWFPEVDLVASHSYPLERSETAQLAKQLADARARAERPAHRVEAELTVPEGIEVSVRTLENGELIIEQVDDLTRIEGPRGPVLLHFSREGCVDRWTRTFLGVNLWSAAKSLPAFASLRVEVPGPSEIVGIEGYDLEDLTTLHPGPFDCVVRLFDGRRVALQLQLEPGAERVLRLE
jgi:hypothetical protein